MFKLKRIELLGFKSFADRTRLEFGDGTVAIVGPNGCGKSNISDAISWVLGEQSAKSLRGERMADVIFNGTGTRPPTGMAEASVTLIDPEYVEAPASLPSAPASPAEDGSSPESNPSATSAAESEGELLPASESPATANPESENRPSTLKHRAGEIVVTRRLFRSGESEYLMNGEVCRLRDIQDLFMGTGLGPESYAIIEQGRIGQILSSKPSDRRAIIEEAAGVSKFKTRKRLAEAKLESSRQNLARITDILVEVTKQMNSLKRQASKARRYREMSEEMRGKLKVVLTSRLIALETQCNALRDELAKIQAECSEAARQLESLEREEKTARSHHDEVDASVTQLRQILAQGDLERERLKSRVEQIREHSAGLEARTAESSHETEQLQAQLGGLEKEAAERAASGQQVREDWKAAQDTVARLSARQEQLTADFSSQEKQIEACRQQLLVTVSRAADLRNQLVQAEEVGLALERQLARLASESTTVEREHQRLNAEFQAFGQDHEREAGSLARLTQSVAETSAMLSDARAEASRRQNELEASRQELSTASARKQALEESLARHAYTTETVRRLLSGPIPINGHHFRPLGVLADFVEVASGYEEAVEEFLKDALDYVVVECHEQARSGIALLKSQGAGRSTFFVTRMPSNGHNGRHEAHGPADCEGLADEGVHETATGNGDVTGNGNGEHVAAATSAMHFSAVSASKKPTNGDAILPGAVRPNGVAAAQGVIAPLERVVSFAAGLGLNGDMVFPALVNTYLVEDSGSAERLAASYPESHFLTMTGEHYQHRLVSGGRGASRGPLALRREFRDLEQRTADLNVTVSTREKEATETSARVTYLEEQLQRLSAAKLEAEKKAVVANEKLRQLRESLDRAAERLGILKQETTNLEAERQEVLGRQTNLRSEMQTAAEEQKRREAEISQASNLLRELRAQLDSLARDLIDAQARSSALEERTRSLEAEHSRLMTQIEDVRERLRHLAEQRADWGDEQQRLAQELEASRARLSEIEGEQDTARGRLSALEQELEMLRARRDALSPLIESARAQFDSLREKRSEIEVARARLESDLGHAAQQCREELKTEPAALMAELPAEAALSGEPLQAAEQELAELKAKIESLGPVNMMALEELQEAEERYGFLETQRQDLLASIEDTAQAIREIDQVSRQQFIEAFTAINGYFTESFRTLFGGGNGQLRLTDESDPESGVDMAAQPPGKRLQNVLLLSGGEKALAALALLIALFRYTPSPFCILDEVDAPLDESNVDRFTRLIQQMSRQTQFILITHNKKTMEVAAALYGVTMEEPGVSKLVSVRFEDVAA